MAETPFGTMGGVSPLAPTKKQVAETPGAYDGTSFDPTIQRCDQFTARIFSDKEFGQPIATWADFYKQDADGALAMFSHPGQYGHPLNLQGLTTAQKARMGISHVPSATLLGIANQVAVTQAMLSTVLSVLAPAPGAEKKK